MRGEEKQLGGAFFRVIGPARVGVGVVGGGLGIVGVDGEARGGSARARRLGGVVSSIQPLHPTLEA